MMHEYKLWGEFYEALLSGDKPFDVRRVDALRVPVEIGDQIRFIELSGDKCPTGRAILARVTYVLRGDDVLLPRGWFVVGLSQVRGV